MLGFTGHAEAPLRVHGQEFIATLLCQLWEYSSTKNICSAAKLQAQKAWMAGFVQAWRVPDGQGRRSQAWKELESNWEKGDKKTGALMDRENPVGSMHWKLEWGPWANELVRKRLAVMESRNTCWPHSSGPRPQGIKPIQVQMGHLDRSWQSWKGWWEGWSSKLFLSFDDIAELGLKETVHRGAEERALAQADKGSTRDQQRALGQELGLFPQNLPSPSVR